MQAQTRPETTLLTEPITNVSDSIEAGAQSLSCYIVDFVNRIGFPQWTEPIISGIILSVILAGLAFLIFFILRPFVLKGFIRIAEKTENPWDDKLVRFGVARWVSHFFSALILNFLIPDLLGGTPELGRLLNILAQVYLVVSGLMAVNSLLNGAKFAFNSRVRSHRMPVTSLVQVLKLLAFLIALILTVSTLAGRSPIAFLGGLGVFTSVIMLVFKDAILGFVAGIQLSYNDMVRVGDWITVPKHGADGDVTEVGLTTVKVMNFDKTITTIPTYALIAESFKNWSSMPESGGRRIKRSVFIDVNSVKLCDSELLDQLRGIGLISDYINQRVEEIEAWNREHEFDTDLSCVNGRQLTNIGTYRAYIEAYLKFHPLVHSEGMTLLVRQLDSGPNGIPIEIYCFTTVTEWKRYEEIQADIFDHLFAVAPEFDLKVFQNPTNWNSETTVQMYGLHHTVVDADKVEKPKG